MMQQPDRSGRFLLIDNFDSFTYNLVQYLGELGIAVDVCRNNALTASQAIAEGPDAILLSPGPGRPDDAGICVELVLRAAEAGIPLLGVCLGHQAVGRAFGLDILPCNEVVHGKTSSIHHDGHGIFAHIPSPFRATRYHSLIVSSPPKPPDLLLTAWLEDGTPMALQHRDRPIFGVQFHPESIATPNGHDLLGAFCAVASQVQHG